MIFGRRGFFGYSVRDHGDVYWFANMTWDGGTTRESLGAVSPAEWKRQLLDLFADDVGPARDILGATTDELAAFPVYDMPVVPIWHRDSMVIIGDAAHATSPTSGQGASMAIEDAIVWRSVSAIAKASRRSPPMSGCGGNASSASSRTQRESDRARPWEPSVAGFGIC